MKFIFIAILCFIFNLKMNKDLCFQTKYIKIANFQLNNDTDYLISKNWELVQMITTSELSPKVYDTLYFKKEKTSHEKLIVKIDHTYYIKSHALNIDTTDTFMNMEAGKWKVSQAKFIKYINKYNNIKINNKVNDGIKIIKLSDSELITQYFIRNSNIIKIYHILNN